MPSKDFTAGPATTIGSKVKNQTIRISSGNQFADAAIYMDGYNLLQVRLPAVWTAADLEVHASEEENDPASPTSANFKPLFDSKGIQVLITTPTADRVYAFVADDAVAVATCKYILLKSSVNQAADRDLETVVKG